MIVDADHVALIDERLDAVQALVDQLRLTVANIRMANADDSLAVSTRWIVRDNLRRMPQAIADLHLRLGRLNMAIEIAEDEASAVPLLRR